MSSSILFPTNEYAVSSKSPEQIQKLSMPLFEHTCDAVQHIVSKGLPPQFQFVYRNAHRAHRVALQMICANALTEEPANQISIAKSLQILIQEKREQLTAEEIEMMFEVALECLNNLHSQANEEMGRLLQASIGAHPTNKKLIKKLEETALELGKQSQPIISKVTSGRLISMLAVYLGRTIKGQMIDIVKRILCENQVEVRKVWVSEIFPRLLKNLQLQFIELHLQEKIYEAVWDQNQDIATLALQSILRNVGRFSSEEQNTRIVKLFIDSLTSKRDKIMALSTQLMGQAFQKLMNCILGSQQMSLRFWKSLIQLAVSKNERVVNNLVYNLPGVLVLSASHHRIDPLCEIYIQLFYQPLTDKVLLASYYHEVVLLFPNKWSQLRQLAYWMFHQLFEQEDPVDQAIKIVQKMMHKLPVCKAAFLEGQGGERYFDPVFCDYFMQFLSLLQNQKMSLWLTNLHISIKECWDCFSTQMVDSTLLPRLYLALRGKPSGMEHLCEAVAKLVMREASSSVINGYTSKISVELCKSSKSYQRQTALVFFYYASFYCSIQLFQQYRLGEKFLSFSTDKKFKVRTSFIRLLPRVLYFLTREEKIEYTIILSRLAKDQDYQIRQMMEQMDFVENQEIKREVVEHSKVLRELEKEKALILCVRKQNQIRRSSKEIKKEDVLKKKIDNTKSKTKMVIKDLPRKKMTPVLLKTSTHFNFRKNS